MMDFLKTIESIETKTTTTSIYQTINIMMFCPLQITFYPNSGSEKFENHAYENKNTFLIGRKLLGSYNSFVRGIFLPFSTPLDSRQKKIHDVHDHPKH